MRLDAPTPADVHIVVRGERPEHHDRPHVVWVAPGSRDPEAIGRVFVRRGRLDDLARLDGPWAAVLWDPRRQTHVALTDPVGIQPLHWAVTAKGDLALSSWLAALVDRPDVDDTLDADNVLLASLRGIGGDECMERTPFRRVRRVPFGRSLVIAPDSSTSTVRHWDPAATSVDESLSLADAARLLRERVDAAVRSHVADSLTGTQFAAHVSGGLDCTAVACRAQQVLAESGGALVAGYSWSPDPDDVPLRHDDERRLLADVEAMSGMPIVHTRMTSEPTWFSELDRFRYPSNTYVAEQHVAPAARAAGAHVVLSGWGGDELASFNGRNVLRARVRRGDLRTVWSNAVGRAQLEADGPIGPARRLYAFGGTLFRLSPSWVQSLADPRSAWDGHRHERWLRRELETSYPEVAAIRAEHTARWQRIRDHHDMQLALLGNGHIQNRTSGWYQSGRLLGVTYRYPLLDIGVVEAALSLPWWAFRHGGWSRVAFRTAIEPWVPPSVAWNITKQEPAFFGALASMRSAHSAAPSDEDTASDDPAVAVEVRAAQALARAHAAVRVRRMHPTVPVIARPDAAPERRSDGAVSSSS